MLFPPKEEDPHANYTVVQFYEEQSKKEEKKERTRYLKLKM